MFFKKKITAEDFGELLFGEVLPISGNAVNTFCHKFYEDNLSDYDRLTEEKRLKIMTHYFLVSFVELMNRQIPHEFMNKIKFGYYNCLNHICPHECINEISSRVINILNNNRIFMIEGKWYPDGQKLSEEGVLFGIIDFIFKTIFTEKEFQEKIYSKQQLNSFGDNDYFVIFASKLIEASNMAEAFSNKVKIKG